jgi:hypothetical protein
MHWIGIGFLIAIGFGLASVALPLAIGLFIMAWELKAIVGVVLGVLLVIVLAIAYPQTIWPIVFWGFVALAIFGNFNGKKKKTQAIQKTPVAKHDGNLK